ncbi:MAG: alkaline phosphatase family protein [Candidatus Binataceae bacterium]|nr:alkaline phosphatase family protein [Candidatus Binataceae bacterium]
MRRLGYFLKRAAGAIAAVLALAPAITAAAPSAPIGKIFVLMVWDGLRPDAPNPADTPNLIAFERGGVEFSAQHSIYPTVTMVNAAALATGAPPAVNGIYADSMYFAPILDLARAVAIPTIGPLLANPIDIEHTQFLAGLNGPLTLDGRLIGLATMAQTIARAGGYVAIVGKQGPTLLFDDEMAPGAPLDLKAGNFMFVADDYAQPAALADELKRQPPISRGDLISIAVRDAWFTHLAVAQALPAARTAAQAGRPAMVIVWEHNPDLTQHIAGLGTQPSIDALKTNDRNLGALRAAIAALGVADRTDLMVVSDHGFATIKAEVPVASLLVAAGLKRALASTEIVVVADGGSDLVYLSRSDFPTAAARHAELRRIVDFAAAQEWCGPIFARDDAGTVGAGAIGGTFSEAAFGLGESPRAPDLIISFREFADATNRGLTGPANPAAIVGRNGIRPAANKSYGLVRAVDGVIYSDVNHFTTGMGMHGAVGRRELHNFCAASGPDFRRGLVDKDPTSNADIAPTVERIFGRSAPAGVSGRVMGEALAPGFHARAPGRPRVAHVTVTRMIGGTRVTTTLMLTRFAGHQYLDDASVTRTPAR